MEQNFVLATYLIETPYSLEHAAKVIANEQSTGTFTSVPGETSMLKEMFGAKVVSIKELDPVKEPSLPGVKRPSNHDGIFRRGEIVISFPVNNFGPSIPNLLAAVAGNLFELQELSGLRLIDIELPEFKPRLAFELGDIVQASSKQVVHANHLVAFSQQCFAEMRTNKTSSACN